MSHERHLACVNLRLLLAWLHLLALAMGLAAVWGRARAMGDTRRHPEDPRALRRAFTADTWWGVAAVLWLVTGLWRLLAGMEKATTYYLGNSAFLLKMAIFIAILLLEIWPMRTLIGWRRKATQPSAGALGRIEAISYLQCMLVVAMVLAAVSMARGFGVRGVSAQVPPSVAALESTLVQPSPAPDVSVLDSVVGPPPALVAAPVVEATAPHVDIVVPTGTETVTDADLALLAREIAMPLDGIATSGLKSSFNERRGGGTRPHEALDIMASRGTPVKSATSGRVLRLFNSVAGGLMVYATDSSERFILLYGHLDRYADGVHDGDAIKRGQVIGYVGSTGNAAANAPHLHFAVLRSADVKQWSKGTALDPLPVLQKAAR